MRAAPVAPAASQKMRFRAARGPVQAAAAAPVHPSRRGQTVRERTGTLSAGSGQLTIRVFELQHHVLSTSTRGRTVRILPLAFALSDETFAEWKRSRPPLCS